MYELLDAAGATLCDPLLIILLAVMMMPSGGFHRTFSPARPTTSVSSSSRRAPQRASFPVRTGEPLKAREPGTAQTTRVSMEFGSL